MNLFLVIVFFINRVATNGAFAGGGVTTAAT